MKNSIHLCNLSIQTFYFDNYPSLKIILLIVMSFTLSYRISVSITTLCFSYRCKKLSEMFYTTFEIVALWNLTAMKIIPSFSLQVETDGLSDMKTQHCEKKTCIMETWSQFYPQSRLTYSCHYIYKGKKNQQDEAEIHQIFY